MTAVRTGYELLTPAQAERIDLICDRFEGTWRQKRRPTIETHLAEAGDGERPVLLRELILIDVLYRGAAGDKPAAADYRTHYPELDDEWLQSALLPRQAVPAVPTAHIDANPPEVPGFKIVGELGRGGMGVVYKAEDTRLGRFVALKFLAPAAAREQAHLDRFRREARAAGALNHPGVCTLHDVGEHLGRPFLVLEYVEGRTLRSLVGTNPNWETLLPLVRQVAEALKVAHAAGIVHRDIKPENLMVRPDGYVKVLDFGLARLQSGPTGSGLSSNTRPGSLIGTVHYMSPEQARGQKVSPLADIFSLGVVLYELATGQRPFDADGVMATRYAIAKHPHLPPSQLNPDIPEALAALIDQMLAKEPSDRPTAAAVERSLGEMAPRTVTVNLSPIGDSRRIIGREQERALLWEAFTSAAGAHGRMVCLTGEAGIGKTSLVEEFFAELTASGRPHAIARGRCSERLAGAEGYLPLLEALESLLRGEAGETAAKTMSEVAPSWYAQVAPSAEPAAPTAASQERMKRELLAFLEQMCRVQPLTIFLDDVHWGDASTVDLLAYVGSRCANLRLLLVVTYRPTEILLGPHPFLAVQLELQRRGTCREVALEFLTRADVAGYLTLAFPGHRFPMDFAHVLHAKTEGNPLFLVDLLSYMRSRGALAKGSGGWKLAQDVPDFGRELPESVRSLIRKKLGQLREDDQQLLSVASVQGHEFDSAVVACVLDAGEAEVEERLVALEQVHGLVRLRREQELPDGTLSLRYHFVHVLYQNSLYTALQPARRIALSAAVAQTLLNHHGEKSGVLAGELALLFEAARDWPLAVDYFGLAAENAARVFASKEAIVLARRGLGLLPKMPDTPRRAQQELRLLMALTTPLQTIQGYAAREVGEACSRARFLCDHLGESVARHPVYWRLALFDMVRGELQSARDLGEQCLRLAETAGNPGLQVVAHTIFGCTLVYQGELQLALGHLRKTQELHDPIRDVGHLILFGNHPVVIALCFTAWAEWLLGFPDHAMATIQEALKLAESVGHPHSLANAHYFAATLHRYRREPTRTFEESQALIKLTSDQGLVLYNAAGTIWLGWALTQQGKVAEGMQQIYRGASAFRATGARVQETQFVSMIAEAQVIRGQVDDGLNTLAEALSVVSRGGESYEEAELHRLRGEFLLRQSPPQPAEAEACFRQAIAIAQKKETRSFELRAALSLAHFQQRQGKYADGIEILAKTHGWFTEGWGTADLLEAKEFLRGHA